jgi:threonine synthase
MECFVFMPADAPAVNLYEAALHGARVHVVEGGLIDTCGAIVREGVEKAGWFDLSTLKEPYRLEGKKTMGLELAEQLNWRLPDAIFYPTGGGTGLIGMWKAFAELGKLGWLEDEALPRMYACQSSGCSLYPPAYEALERFAEPVENPETIAAGLRVPRAVGDFMVLDAVRESGGKAVAAPEECIEGWTRRASALEGISLCPESAVCLEVIAQGLSEGYLHADETLVVFNTAAAQKYVEVLETDLPVLDPGAVDWDRF